jgi:hypothetical protein
MALMEAECAALFRPTLAVMRDCCGMAKDAPADYVTNPKYMEGFGR